MKLRSSRAAFLYGLFLSLCMAQHAAHAEMDAVVRNALAQAESGQARQAYLMLEPLEVDRAGDPDFDTVFGIAANQSGEHARAIMALERATIVQPGNTRARAELGRAMFAVGDSKSARTLLEQAKAQGAPAEAALTIDQFLRAIDVAEALTQSAWNGYVEASVGHDSNIPSGPTNSNVAVPLLGGNITLNPNSVKKSASFGNLTAGVAARYVIDSRLSLVGNAALSTRANVDESQFNNNQVNVGGGVAYRLDQHEFTVVGVHEEYKLDGALSRIQNGLVAEWVYRIDGTRETGGYLQHSRLHYPGQTIRDADRTVLGGSYAQQFGSGWLGWGGLYLGSEDETASGVPHLGHALAGLRLGVQKTIHAGLAGFASMSYENRRYGGQDPFFLAKRKDDQTSLSVGLHWVPVKSWRITPQVSYIRNQSTIVISDYDRTVAAVVARLDF